MEFFKNTTALVVPRWLKMVIVGLLLALIALYCISTAVGIAQGMARPWFEAGADVLHVLIPLLLVVLIAAYAESGVTALQDRVTNFLTTVVPSRLIGLVDPTGVFCGPRFAGRKEEHGLAPQVLIQTSKGHFIANYYVRAPVGNHAGDPDAKRHRKLVFRLELNARHLNVNLCVTAPPGEQPNMPVVERFKHTIEGAKNGGYWFNSVPIRRHIEGKDYVCIVGARTLDDDFLINSIAKLDVAQDLALMLRAFMNESPESFEYWDAA